jgi:hypothetical protein
MARIKITVKDCLCPVCGAPEVHPADEGKPIMEKRLLVRGFKVYCDDHWWSQCLVCSGFYNDYLVETPANHDENKGWF